MLKTFFVLSSFFLIFTFVNLFAESPWSRPQTLSSLNARDPKIGIDSAGNAVAMWYELSGKNKKILTARFTHGKWSKPVTVATMQVNCKVIPQIALAVDNNGNAVAVWRDCVNDVAVIKAATMFSTGSWSEAATLANATPKLLSKSEASAAGGFFEPLVDVAINSSGFVVAVWRSRIDNRSILEAATLQLGGKWSEPSIISATDNKSTSFEQLRTAVDASHNAALIWQKVSYESGLTIEVEAATLPYGENWSKPVTLSRGSAPYITFDPLGNVIALWDNWDVSHFSVYTSTFSFGGTWSNPVAISAPKTSAVDSHLAFDQKGNALAAWNLEDRASGNEEEIYIEASYRPVGGDWLAPIIISEKTTSQGPKVGFDSFGNAIVAWDDQRKRTVDTHDETVILAAVRTAEGNWIPPETLSAQNQKSTSPNIAVASNGFVAVVWTNQTFTTIQAATCSSISELPSND